MIKLYCKRFLFILRKQINLTLNNYNIKKLRNILVENVNIDEQRGFIIDVALSWCAVEL